MGRAKDPNTKFKMKRFVSGGRPYAVTVDPSIGSSGKRKSNISIWGSLDDYNVFHPNLRFRLLDDKERDQYIFPADWDISEKYSHEGVPDSGTGEIYQGEDRYRLYGDTLLLKEAASASGIEEDLQEVFGDEVAQDILSIAFYLLTEDKNLNRMEASQRIHWFPTARAMDPTRITRITQFFTKDSMDKFMALRRKRAGEEALWFGVDSTSISSYSQGLADVKWGKNKEHDILRQTGLMVMYDMKSNLPVHYRKLPGNIPDSRTMRLLIDELKSVGFSNAGFILDRDYLTKENLDLLVPDSLKAIFMAKTTLTAVRTAIREASSVEGNILKTGTYLEGHDCYGKDYVYPYSYKETEGKGRGVELPQRLCLYFDPERQGIEMKEISKRCAEEERSLEYHKTNQIVPDEQSLKQLTKYHHVELDNAGLITAYTLQNTVVENEMMMSGYFAVVCCNMPIKEYSLDWVLDKYGMRDKQEKAFMYYKSWQGGRRTRTSTESGTEGRFFIQFVTLILNCLIHNLLADSSKELNDKFASPWAILDEMTSVRLMEVKGRKPKVSKFVGWQVKIFDEFGFKIPQGSRPKSKPEPKKKSG